ncbi:hypothetical protein D3C71_1187350 [compost metagenome]
MIFRGSGHQCLARPQGSLVTDAQCAEEFFAADVFALTAIRVYQCNNGRDYGCTRMPLGGEVTFMCIQAINAETACIRGAQWMYGSAVEPKSAGQLVGRVVGVSVGFEHHAGLIIASTGGHTNDVEQASFNQLACMQGRVLVTEILDE